MEKESLITPEISERIAEFVSSHGSVETYFNKTIFPVLETWRLTRNENLRIVTQKYVDQFENKEMLKQLFDSYFNQNGLRNPFIF